MLGTSAEGCAACEMEWVVTLRRVLCGEQGARKYLLLSFMVLLNRKEEHLFMMATVWLCESL